MKAKKRYFANKVVVSIASPSCAFQLVFPNEQEMKLCGECLCDLARIGGKEVTIGETV